MLDACVSGVDRLGQANKQLAITFTIVVGACLDVALAPSCRGRHTQGTWAGTIVHFKR